MVLSGKHFQPSLMFVGKVKSLTKSIAPESGFTQVGFSLSCKNYTWLVRLARDRHLAYFETLCHYAECRYAECLYTAHEVLAYTGPRKRGSGSSPTTSSGS